VIEGGGGASFALEAFEELGILGHGLGKKFEGNAAAEVGVFGFVDHAHSAAAELASDAVMRKGLADYGFRGWHGGIDTRLSNEAGQAGAENEWPAVFISARRARV
jgi:hypothetical protein